MNVRDLPIVDHAAWVADALRDPFAWWLDHAQALAWERAPQTAFTGTIDDPHWFPDGRLNATVSCLDRHAATHPDAIGYLDDRLLDASVRVVD